MDKINRLIKNKVEFTYQGKVLTGYICKHFQRKPVSAQIYIVAVGNEIYQIHETLSHGQTINTEIEKVTPFVWNNIKAYYGNLEANFNYVQVS
jgi:hypothetical protein